MNKHYDVFPTDWELKRLGDIASTTSGKTPAKSQYRNTGDIKIIKFRDLKNDGHLDFSNDENGWLNSEDCPSGLVELEADSILLTNAAHSPTHIGKKIGFLKLLPNEYRVCFVGELSCIRSETPKLKTEWLYILLQSEPIRREIQKAVEGAHLVPYWLTKIKIPIAPLEVQSEHIGLLNKLDQLIRVFREKERLALGVAKALTQRCFCRGLRNGSRLVADPNVGDVPSNWRVVRMKEVMSEVPFTGISPLSRPLPPGVPILNVGCIKNGECTLDKISYVDADPKAIKKNAAHKDDFFVLRGNGNRNLVATGGWLRDSPPKSCIFSDKLIRLRFDRQKVAKGFIPFLWRSNKFLRRLQSKAQSSSGLWMYTKRDICREWVAIPPIDEQEEIVTVLAAAYENITSIRKVLELKEKRRTCLLQQLATGARIS